MNAILRTSALLAALLASGPAAVAQTAPAQLTTQVQTVLDSTRARIALNERYDPSYVVLAYPGGDVANDRGVCTDVVIRAWRELGVDLQVLVHEDMRAHFGAYPKSWGLRRPDRNIDHRRVPNLQTYFNRHGASLPVSQDAAAYRPGDLVTWRLSGNRPHIGIVSDRTAPGSERPLILHNIGAGTAEDDILFAFPITGHYRFYPPASR